MKVLIINQHLFFLCIRFRLRLVIMIRICTKLLIWLKTFLPKSNSIKRLRRARINALLFLKPLLITATVALPRVYLSIWIAVQTEPSRKILVDNRIRGTNVSPLLVTATVALVRVYISIWIAVQTEPSRKILVDNRIRGTNVYPLLVTATVALVRVYISIWIAVQTEPSRKILKYLCRRWYKTGDKNSHERMKLTFEK